MAELNAESYKHYLRDLGDLVRAQALDAKRRSVAAAGTEEAEFRNGYRLAYHSIVSLMQQQAEAFGIPLDDLRLDGLDADRDLL